MTVISDELTVTIVDMLTSTLSKSMSTEEADVIVKTAADLLYSFTEEGKKANV